MGFVDVEKQILRGNPISIRVVPAHDEARHRRARFIEGRRRVRDARLQSARRGERRNAVVDRCPPPCVAEVAERDDADAVVGQPSHLRSVTR